MISLAMGSVKVLLLLVAAAGITAVSRGLPARVRVAVWCTALAGSLLIPLVEPILPPLGIPVPVNLPTATSASPAETAAGSDPSSFAANRTPVRRQAVPHPESSMTHQYSSHLGDALWILWIAGVTVLAARLCVGIWFMRRAVRNARTITEYHWIRDLRHLRCTVKCRRPVRLVMSDVVEIPATVGLWRPTIIVPAIAKTWPSERREAVLLHELIHVARMDWSWRLVARAARTVYWFNPLMWWAVRRLDLEQELACDQEVVALGTRPSSYACHLLGIARAAVRQPIPAVCVLEMARKSHLEERIMTILENRHHRRIGLATLGPAVILVAAMVPAIAAMAPADSPNNPELKQVLTEINAAEARMEPHLKQIEELEIEIDERALAAIEEQMQPYLERIEEIEVNLEPMHEYMEEIERKMENFEIHVEPGNLAEIEHQIHEQLEAVHRQMEQVHMDMEPFHEQIEEIHRQMEPLHEQIEQLHIAMGPMHEQMDVIHREMEPFHEEMELLGQRLENALNAEVAGRLRQRLGAFTDHDAPFSESAAKILDGATINVSDDRVHISAPQSETLHILSDLLGPHRIGTQQNFDNAVQSAAAEISNLEIRAD